MKNLLLFSLLLILVWGCEQNPSNPAASKDAADTAAVPANKVAPQDDPDLVAITAVIHDFYKWYDAFQQDDARNIDITSDKGKHLKLDAAKMDRYYANLKASGFISDEFIQHDREVMKKCEVRWQQEEMGDVPSCMDADRFFCAQDWELKYWTTAPVAAEGLGTDRVKATMSGVDGGTDYAQKFELKKENGKWLIAVIDCDILGEE